MANQEHLNLLRQGKRVWERWREENVLLRPDLTGADLIGADLIGADLRGAKLIGAKLGQADLTIADLRGADLSRASLGLANLSGADLSKANLSVADLSGVDLSGAILEGTVFGHTNLSGAEHLDQCHHAGPSTIDLRTIRQSWPLPLPFLRGCGLDDTFIEYIPSFLGQPIQYNSCFISYSSRDEAFAQRLHADLQNRGVRCWFAPEDMKAGRKLHQQITDAIHLHDKLLLILSEESMKSNWVEVEIRNARKRERAERRQLLFPVRLCDFDALRSWELLDADEGRDLAATVREYSIPDFSVWKDHDAYQRAFNRLLRDLKTEEAKAQERGRTAS